MKVEHFPLDQTGQFPRLITDYLSAHPDMDVFVNYSPDLTGAKERVADLKSLNKDSGLLAKVLEEQLGDSITSTQKENLSALAADHAYTVCTGHQLCLFGGPVYMMYKIASVISLAKKLTLDTGQMVVPLFWMASEDHDVQEVSSISLFDRRIAIQSDHQGPVGEMGLAGISEALTELESILGESPNAQKAMNLMRLAYVEGEHMASAFRNLIQSLFGKYGLLILDASDHRLKKSFSERMSSEVLDLVTSNAIETTLDMLKNRGENIQAHPREINLFYMTNDSRNRLIQEGEHIAVLNGPTWSLEEFRIELDQHPERFSPNVLFRPVYQEFLLPNIAYVGGPGELSYWLQLKDVFTAFELRMPMLVLRDSIMWVDEKTEKRWTELGFELSDLFRDEDALFKEYATKNAEEDTDLSADKEVMVRQFDKLIERSRAIDPGILGFANSERTKLLKSIENLEKKLVRAEKKKHSDSLNRISNIKSKFLPGGGLRERKENFLHWYLRYGDEFFDNLLAISDPLDARVKMVKV